MRRRDHARHRGRFEPDFGNVTPPPPTTEIEFVAAGASAASATNGATPGLPAGIASGDVLICAAAMRGTGTPSMSGDWTLGEVVGYTSSSLTPIAGYLMDAAASGTSPSTIDQIFGDGSADLQSFGSVGGYTTDAGGRLFSADFLVAPGVTGTVYDAINGGTAGRQITIVVDVLTGTDLPDMGELLVGLGLDENQIANLRLGLFFSGADSSDARVHLNGAEVWSLEEPMFATSSRYVVVIVLDTPNATAAQRLRVFVYDGTDFTQVGTTGAITQDTAMTFTSGTDEMIVGCPVGTNDGKVGALFWYQGAADDALAQSLAEQVFANHDAAPSLGGIADTSLAWWWHRYTGAAPSAAITRTSSDCIIAGIVAYRNALAAGDPIDATSSWYDPDGIVDDEVFIGDPVLTSTVNDAMALFLIAEQGNSAIGTPSGGVTWIEEFEAGTSLGSDVRLGIANGLKVSAGAIDAAATVGTSARHVGAGLALAPET